MNFQPKGDGHKLIEWCLHCGWCNLVSFVWCEVFFSLFIRSTIFTWYRSYRILAHHHFNIPEIEPIKTLQFSQSSVHICLLLLFWFWHGRKLPSCHNWFYIYMNCILNLTRLECGAVATTTAAVAVSSFNCKWTRRRRRKNSQAMAIWLFVYLFCFSIFIACLACLACLVGSLVWLASCCRLPLLTQQQYNNIQFEVVANVAQYWNDMYDTLLYFLLMYMNWRGFVYR